MRALCAEGKFVGLKDRNRAASQFRSSVEEGRQRVAAQRAKFGRHRETKSVVAVPQTNARLAQVIAIGAGRHFSNRRSILMNRDFQRLRWLEIIDRPALDRARVKAVHTPVKWGLRRRRTSRRPQETEEISHSVLPR